MPPPAPVADTPLPDALIETHLRDLLAALPLHTLLDRSGGPGRPAILPATTLYTALLVGTVRDDASRAALFRRIAATGFWDHPPLDISLSAIQHRLERIGPQPLAELFHHLSAHLLATTAPDPALSALAPFATEIVALDESTLDPIARRLTAQRLPSPDSAPPAPAGTPPRRPALLPGTVAAVFDLRRQLFRTIQLRPDPAQNEKVAARDLAATLPTGALILADLGYFSFAWFDDLTTAGQHWVSRQRDRVSVEVLHTFHQQHDATGALVRQEQLVWLGRYRADRAAHPVRLVGVRDPQGHWREYLTNMLDPGQLDVGQIVALYARRWDIERAVKLVKRDLGLHLVYGSRWEAIAQQVWGVLTIAQVGLSLRRQVAVAAAVDDFDVSIELLLRDGPELARREVAGGDLIGWLAREGRRFGYVRPARRVRYAVPDRKGIWAPAPAELLAPRVARYAGRRCGPGRTDRPQDDPVRAAYPE